MLQSLDRPRIIIAVLVLLVCLQPFLILNIASTLESSVSSSLRSKVAGNSERWAYVFLLADCDPTLQFPSYRGIFFNIIAATYILKHHPTNPHSQADVVVMVQMSSSTDVPSLPIPEEELLHKMGVHLEYLPKPQSTPTFYDLVKSKFHVSTWMIQEGYSKVLFLDGDVLPFCSLDYLLEEQSSSVSSDTPLRFTVLHAMYEDPVNAGLFVFSATPGMAELEKSLQDWNETIQQWGSIPNDQVDYRLWDGKQGQGWDFYCGNTDQGFLLYWSRFLQQDVSIITGPTIEHYSPAQTDPSNHQPISSSQALHSTTSTDWMATKSCLPPVTGSTSKGRTGTFAQNSNVQASSLPFYQDFYHMVGYSKAWESKLRRYPLPQRQEELISSHEYWYWILEQAQTMFDPQKTVIPTINSVTDSVGKPAIRGDLIVAGHKPSTPTTE
eukprot:Nitzschia sp. Nitz4//scaffold291_size36643//16690//18006//NITZ4_007764-RA/size36643-processed-gene-0.28-mRNA-1//-1//CDS//3329546130//2578//frame0